MTLTVDAGVEEYGAITLEMPSQPNRKVISGIEFRV